MKKSKNSHKTYPQAVARYRPAHTPAYSPCNMMVNALATALYTDDVHYVSCPHVAVRSDLSSHLSLPHLTVFVAGRYQQALVLLCAVASGMPILHD